MTRPAYLEPLESRIALSSTFSLSAIGMGPVEGPAAPAPVISPDGKTATFVDLDGDIFNVTTTKGKFTTANFLYTAGETEGTGLLRLIDISLATAGKAFRGAKISVSLNTVVGDGLADVSMINAAGIDLKQVAVDGDLGRLDVGDSNLATPALGLLEADQLGFQSVDRFPDGIVDRTSHIVGGVGKIDVGDWRDAFIDVTGGAKPSQAKLGKVGTVFVTSMTGGIEVLSGALRASGPISKVVIQGSLTGGEGDLSGVIWSLKKIGSATVGGNVQGGAGDLSGSILSGAQNAEISGGAIGAVTIGGNLMGGEGDGSGTLTMGGKLKTATIQGDVAGGPGNGSGSILAGTANSIAITGSLRGGPIQTGVLIQGVLGKFSAGSIGAEGEVVHIVAGGPSKGGAAIREVVVSGSVIGAQILAGYNVLLEPSNADASIGKIDIGGSLRASSIVAGIDAVNAVFGDGDDILIAGGRKAPIAKISRITVGEAIEGTEGGTDQFAILAQRIGTVTVGGTPLSLDPKELDDLALGTFGDYRLRELA